MNSINDDNNDIIAINNKYNGIEVPYYTKADESIKCSRCKEVYQYWEMGKNRWNKYYHICPKCRDKSNINFKCKTDETETGYARCVLCKKSKPFDEMGKNKVTGSVNQCCIECRDKSKNSIKINKKNGRKIDKKEEYIKCKCLFCDEMYNCKQKYIHGNICIKCYKYVTNIINEMNVIEKTKTLPRITRNNELFIVFSSRFLNEINDLLSNKNND